MAAIIIIFAKVCFWNCFSKVWEGRVGLFLKGKKFSQGKFSGDCEQKLQLFSVLYSQFNPIFFPNHKVCKAQVSHQPSQPWPCKVDAIPLGLITLPFALGMSKGWLVCKACYSTLSEQGRNMSLFPPTLFVATGEPACLRCLTFVIVSDHILWISDTGNDSKSY